MIYYALFVALAVSFAFLEIAKPDNNLAKRRMLITLSLIAIVFVGFREDVGGDWDVYLSYYSLAKITSFTEYVQINDPGYMAIGWLFANIGLGIWALNLSCAIIFIYGLAKLASKFQYSNVFFLSAIPYLVIVVGMGYTRQSVAIGLICLSLSKILEEKRFKSAIYGFGSLFFHKSAAVGLIPILLTYSKKLSHTLLILLISLPIIVVAVLVEGLEIAQRGYVEASYNSAGAFVRVLQIFICSVWFFLILRKKIPDTHQRVMSIMAVMSFMSMPALMISPSSTLIDRMILYLLPFQAYVLSKTVELFSPGSSRIFVGGMVILINIAIFLVWITSSDHLQSWINYKNYLWSGSSLLFQFVM